MADRRSNVQTEARGVNTVKTAGSNPARDDAQASTTGPSSAIAATAAATGLLERRGSQGVFRRLSMSGGRKSSMFLAPNQPRPNTYRMEPENEYRFRPYKLQSKIHEVLVEQMKGQTYNAATVNDLVKNITRNVLQLTKHFQLPRYKLVAQATITQKFDQLLRIASRCLWDQKTDNMVSVNYETKDMIAIVTVYAVYLD